MTTLWARLKIWEAYKSGEITEKCAQYFDELLNKYRFREKTLSHVSIVTHKHDTVKEELANFNGVDSNCVLGNIGIKNNIYKEFDPIKYIQKTTYVNGNTKGNEKVYLANLLGQEFVGLDGEILAFLKFKNPSKEDVNLIKTYLFCTYRITAEQDVSRNKVLLSSIYNQLINFHNTESLEKFTNQSN